MTVTIASTRLKSWGLIATISEYAKSLSEDHINLDSITQYLNIVNDCEGSTRSEHLSLTLPAFYLDTDFHFFFLHLQFFQLNLTSFTEASKASNAFCKRMYKNHLQTNKQSI